MTEEDGTREAKRSETASPPNGDVDLGALCGNTEEDPPRVTCAVLSLKTRN